jgi:hypothetical protein
MNLFVSLIPEFYSVWTDTDYKYFTKPLVSSPVRRKPEVFLMGKRIILHVGDLVGNFILIKDLGIIDNGRYKRRRCIFMCPICKKEFDAIYKNIKRGKISSCRCETDKRISTVNFTHGLSKTPVYRLWKSMNTRCYNKNCNAYADYGGRGITVCDEWKNDFMSFYYWAIKNGFKNGCPIDRIDNDNGYSPDNCRFTTTVVNAQNSRLIKSNNTSGYRGVSFNKKLNKWQSGIQDNKKPTYLGIYPTPELAALAYNKYVIEHGTAHPLNIVPTVLEFGDSPNILNPLSPKSSASQ